MYPPLTPAAAKKKLQQLEGGGTTYHRYLTQALKACKECGHKLPGFPEVFTQCSGARMEMCDYLEQHAGLFELFLQGAELDVNIRNGIQQLLCNADMAYKSLTDYHAQLDMRDLPRAKKRAANILFKTCEEIYTVLEMQWRDFRRRLEHTEGDVRSESSKAQAEGVMKNTQDNDGHSSLSQYVVQYHESQKKAGRLTDIPEELLTTGVSKAYEAFLRYYAMAEDLAQYPHDAAPQSSQDQAGEIGFDPTRNAVINVAKMLIELQSLLAEYMKQKAEAQSRCKKNHHQTDMIKRFFEDCEEHVKVFEEEVQPMRKDVDAILKEDALTPECTPCSEQLKQLVAALHYPNSQLPASVRDKINALTRLSTPQSDQTLSESSWSKAELGVLSTSTTLRGCFEALHGFRAEHYRQVYPKETEHCLPGTKENVESWSIVVSFQTLLLEAFTAYQHWWMELSRYGNNIAKHYDSPEARFVILRHTNKLLKPSYDILESMRDHFSSLLCFRVVHDWEDPDYLVLPSRMEAVCPDITAAYRHLRKAIFNILTMTIGENGKEARQRSASGTADKGENNQQQQINQDLFRARMTKALEMAKTLQDKLEMWVDVMKRYTEAVLEEDLAEEMARYLDKNIHPILEVLKQFETVVCVKLREAA